MSALNGLASNKFQAITLTNDDPVPGVISWVNHPGTLKFSHLNTPHTSHITHFSVYWLDILCGILKAWSVPSIIWPNTGILLIGPLGTHFSEISIAVHTFSVKKMRLIASFAKWWPYCLGFNVHALFAIDHVDCVLLCFGPRLSRQSLYSLSGQTSYRKTLWSLEAARLDIIMIVSLWNLTGISAVLRPMCLSNCRAIRKV